ncbi:hypothetical protein HYU92_01800 [Candidatus Curtissbacteria bacterium]|nr:hypothetical protein [Candidatus Curtissbacteria bacterium]
MPLILIFYLISIAATLLGVLVVLKLSIWFYIFTGALTVIILYFLDRTWEKSTTKQRKEEFSENISKGAIGEPAVSRDLNTSEQQILIRMHKDEYFWVSRRHLILPVFGIATYLLFLFWTKSASFFDLFVQKENFTGIGLYLILFPIILLFIYVNFRKKIIRESVLYKDLRSPIFKVKGKLTKKGINDKFKAVNNLIVRGIWFGDEENPQIDMYWEEFDEGNFVEIEYSPFSKHIWSIKKV